MTRKLVVAALTFVSALLPCHLARAQANDTVKLRTVVVSASKGPKPASTLTQPVTVLSGDF